MKGVTFAFQFLVFSHLLRGGPGSSSTRHPSQSAEPSRLVPLLEFPLNPNTSPYPTPDNLPLSSLLCFSVRNSDYTVRTAGMAASSEFRPLTDSTLMVEYIKSTPALSSKLNDQFDDLEIKEVGDGNLNFVYIVVGPSGSLVIKQVSGSFPDLL